MWTSLIDPVAGLLDKFIEDKDEKNRLAFEINTLAEKQAHEMAKAQVEVNKEQAKHPSLFVAGARPAIMWICAFALAYHFIILPFATFVIAVAGIPVPSLPSFDMDSLMTVLLGLLGLGGMRSWEKTRGVARNNLK